MLRSILYIFPMLSLKKTGLKQKKLKETEKARAHAYSVFQDGGFHNVSVSI